jgi:hypothetical protein
MEIRYKLLSENNDVIHHHLYIEGDCVRVGYEVSLLERRTTLMKINKRLKHQLLSRLVCLFST